MADYRPNATAASLLGFLHEGPLTGWELLTNAQERIGDFWSLTQSQIYRELTTMAAEGLIEAGERGPRDRRPYSLTEAGRAAFAAWAEQEPGPETIRFPLLLAVGFGHYLPPGHLAAALARYRARHAARLAKYETYRAHCAEWTPDDPYTLATLDFGIAYERAILGWYAALPEAIKGDIPPDGDGIAGADNSVAQPR